MSEKIVRIGCASGFWGDTPEGARQLVLQGRIDYLIFDYLAEVTMAILARVKEKNPALGYVPDFVSQVIRPLAGDIKARGIKVVVNAGGLNPAGCVAAIEHELLRQDVTLTVAAVLGDDLLAGGVDWQGAGIVEMQTGQPCPRQLLTANAYLGAFPIAQALARGADIVITGRCADSALALGPLVHEFGWRPDQFDELAGGSLAGHVLECGPQSTGGFISDWREFAASWIDIGFPVAECSGDGSFVVTKPAGTGGMVNVKSVAEQVSYETGDPSSYVLPDVICDWRDVAVRELSADRVRVSGARGRSPTSTYKVSATYQDGYRCIATLLIRGREAVAKARRVAEVILGRTRAVFGREQLGDYDEVSLELIGAEDAYGAQARTAHSREVLLKLGVRHASQKALEIFAREVFPVSTSTVQGIAGAFAGRPKVQPVIRLYSFLWPKVHVPISVGVGAQMTACEVPDFGPPAAAGPARGRMPEPDIGDLAGGTAVPLSQIAYARSGDKGDVSNIAVIARRAEYLPVLRAQLTPQAVRDHFRHLVKGEVERFEWPGLGAFNFLLHQALGGGGSSSLLYDPQGKAYAEILLDFEIKLPAGLH